MKKIISIALIAAALIGSLQLTKTKAKASTNLKYRCAFIIVGYQPIYRWEKNLDGIVYRQEDGYIVSHTEGSPNCPGITNGTRLGAAIALLLDEGFTMEKELFYGRREFINRRYHAK